MSLARAMFMGGGGGVSNWVSYFAVNTIYQSTSHNDNWVAWDDSSFYIVNDYPGLEDNGYIKLSRDGTAVEATRQIDVSTNGPDEDFWPLAIDVDGSGNIYLSGVFEQNSGSLAFHGCMKFNSSHVQQFAKKMVNSQYKTHAQCIHNGVFFLAEHDANRDNYYHLIDSNGAHIETRNADDGTYSMGVRVCRDKTGDGFKISFGRTDLRHWVANVDTAGVATDSYGADTFSSGYVGTPMHICCDSAGNTYVYSNGYILSKFSPTNTMLWRKSLSPGATTNDNVHMDVDEDGNLWLLWGILEHLYLFKLDTSNAAILGQWQFRFPADHTQADGKIRVIDNEVLLIQAFIQDASNNDWAYLFHIDKEDLPLGTLTGLPSTIYFETVSALSMTNITFSARYGDSWAVTARSMGDADLVSSALTNPSITHTSL